jgi:hypothetical protein
VETILPLPTLNLGFAPHRYELPVCVLPAEIRDNTDKELRSGIVLVHILKACVLFGGIGYVVSVVSSVRMLPTL